MKLIDSSGWVDYYRPDGDSRIQAAVAEAIEADEAATCGMVRVEILCYIDPEDEFDELNVLIHGIDERSVADAPRFPDIVDAMHTRLAGHVVVSHGADARNLPWSWEGNVQGMIIKFLVEQGYRISRAASTLDREHGRDIEAISPDGRKLWLTVRGYPEKSPHTQERHWFVECLFDVALYRGESATANLGIGLPDGFATYLNLVKRITWLKAAAGFRFYWVGPNGSVRLE